MALKFAFQKGKGEQEQVEKPVTKGSLFGDKKAADIQEDVETQDNKHHLSVFGHETLVDQYLALEAELAPYLEKVKELGALRQTALDLAKEAGEEDASLPVFVRGTDKSLVFTKAGVATVVKEGLMKALKAKVSADALWSLVKFTFTDIKKYLSEVEAAPYLEQAVGARRFDGTAENK
jgi:hypothetical protein